MTIPEMRPLESSHISSVGYDSAGGDLHVVFKDGKHSVYCGVPGHIADGIMNASSVGGAFHSTVKGRYVHRYHEGTDNGTQVEDFGRAQEQSTPDAEGWWPPKC